MTRTPELELAGVNGNWWIGLSVMHTLFNREHNAIVDRLRIEYPDKDGEWLFQKARLVNSALIAKIHATEWTPALMNSPRLRYAMRANWWGTLGEEYLQGLRAPAAQRVPLRHSQFAADHHAAPYAMTEEFTAVYRLHSLIPDDFSFRRHSDDAEVQARPCRTLSGRRRAPACTASWPSPMSSIRWARAIPARRCCTTIPNHPAQDAGEARAGRVHRPGGDRHPARPRARRAALLRVSPDLRMSVPKTFAELTDNKDWQSELEEVYGDVERVDLLVGTLAETKPPGFGSPTPPSASSF